MPENETVALAGEVLWGKRAMWLLLRALGGQVKISDEEWERVPERPELILDRADGVMRWTAKERDDEDVITAGRGRISAGDRAMVARATCGGIRSREIQPQFSGEDEPASPVAAELALAGQSAEEAADIIRDTGA